VNILDQPGEPFGIKRLLEEMADAETLPGDLILEACRLVRQGNPAGGRCHFTGQFVALCIGQCIQPAQFGQQDVMVVETARQLRDGSDAQRGHVQGGEARRERGNAVGELAERNDAQGLAGDLSHGVFRFIR